MTAPRFAATAHTPRDAIIAGLREHVAGAAMTPADIADDVLDALRDAGFAIGRRGDFDEVKS